MKTLRAFLTNGFLLGGLAALALSFVVLGRQPDFEPAEKLIGVILFGLILPLIAWLAMRRARRLELELRPTGAEMLGILAYVAALSLYLAIGPQTIDALLPQSWRETPHLHLIVKTTLKLLVFVALPYLLFGQWLGRTWRDFGMHWEGVRESMRSHLPVILAISGVMLVFQYFAGNAAAPLRRGELSATQLCLGLPLAFLWLAIEAGLVEEFFFRGLLQARLAAWFRSDVTAVVLMALTFAVAHAPGMMFRGAGVVEGLGANPSPLDAIAYTIATIAPIAILFGYIWARTKNLFALILIHAAIDLLPNVTPFVRAWGL